MREVSMFIPSVSPRQNFENVLNYAMKHRNGSLNNLNSVDQYNGKTIKQLVDNGMLKFGYNNDRRTFDLTESGQNLYNDYFRIETL